MREKPILILAMRRVGGTALTNFLSEVSAYETLEHEPFNSDRCLGQITRAFIASSDHEQLENSMIESLRVPVVIKHCIDTVPHEVTRALIKRCKTLDYAFVLLTRDNDASRILSVAVAELTDIWGNNTDDEALNKLLSGTTVIKPFNINSLLRQQKSDLKTLVKVRRILAQLSIDFENIVYEYFFEGTSSTIANALALVKKFGIAITSEDPRFNVLVADHRSITELLLDKVPNSKEALNKLSGHGPRAVIKPPSFFYLFGNRK